VAVIVSGDGSASALAAKAATMTIPIVFALAADPVRAGLVSSFNRPGGNITGIVGFTDALIAKRLELVTELLPNITLIGALLNPSNPNAESRSGDLRAASAAAGRQIRFFHGRIAIDSFFRSEPELARGIIPKREPPYSMATGACAKSQYSSGSRRGRFRIAAAR
jgi:hypothetical protein